MLVPILALALLAIFTTFKWVSFLTFLWAGIIIPFAEVEFWGLCNRLFTLHQGKRWFGYIGACNSFGMILAGVCIPFFVRFISSEVLLLGVPLLLFCCLGLLLQLRLLEPHALMQKVDDEQQDRFHIPDKKIYNVFSSMKNPYIRFLFIGVILMIAVLFLIDFAFNSTVQQFLPNIKDMTDFFAVLFAIASFFEMTCHLMLFPRLLQKFGLIASSLLLPFLTFLTMTASIIGYYAFYQQHHAGIVFLFIIAMSKLIDEVVRFSVAYPTNTLFLQPLMSVKRVWVQTQAGIIIEPIGAILTALIILVVTYTSSSPIVVSLFIALFCALLAIINLLAMRNDYLKTLLTALGSRYYKANDVPAPEINNLKLFMEHLNSPYPGEAIYCLENIRKMNDENLGNAIKIALDHSSPLVKEYALQTLLNQPIKSFYPEAAALLNDNKLSNQIHATAIITVAALAKNPQELEVLTPYLNKQNLELCSASIVGFHKFGTKKQKEMVEKELYSLALSQKINERLIVGAILSHLSETLYPSLIETLLDDAETSVKKSAIKAIAQAKYTMFYHKLLQFLDEDPLRETAIQSIISLQDQAVPLIVTHFSRQDQKQKMQTLEVIKQLNISDESRETLRQFLVQQFSGNEIMDNGIWAALSSLDSVIKDDGSKVSGYFNKQLEMKLQRFNFLDNFYSELVGSKDIKSVKDILRGQIETTESEIFQLLSLQYPKIIIQSISEALNNRDEERVGFAIEVIQRIFSKKHIKQIQPVIERLHKGYPGKSAKDTPQKTNAKLIEIIKNEKGFFSPISRSVALYVIAQNSQFASSDLFTLLMNLSSEEQPLIKETRDSILKRV